MTDDLMERIKLALQVDSQWVGHYDEDDVQGIDHARSAGRRAGRALGVRIRTGQSDPAARSDRAVVVVIFVNEEPPEWKQEENAEKTRQAMDQVFKHVMGKGPLS